MEHASHKSQSKKTRTVKPKGDLNAYDPPIPAYDPPQAPDAPSKEVTSGPHFNRGTDTPEPKAQTKPTANVEVRNMKLTLPEQLAVDRIYVVNWRWPDADKDFPTEPWMRSVRWFYPNAPGGGLAVDEPRFDNEKVICKRKAKALKARGIRYLVYDRQMTLEEAKENINDGMDQGGLKGSTSKPT